MITDHGERASIKLTSPPRLQCIQSSRKKKREDKNLHMLFFSFFHLPLLRGRQPAEASSPVSSRGRKTSTPPPLTLSFSRLSPTNLSIHLGLTALDQFVSRRGETGIGEKSQWKLLIHEGGMKRWRRHSANFPNACYRCDSGLGGKA